MALLIMPKAWRASFDTSLVSVPKNFPICGNSFGRQPSAINVVLLIKQTFPLITYTILLVVVSSPVTTDLLEIFAKNTPNTVASVSFAQSRMRLCAVDAL